MKTKIYLLLSVGLLLAVGATAQNLAGIWKGYFKSSNGETYKLEIQLSHKKNAYAVNGVSYSYLDIRFYGKATMTGNYIFDGKNLRIKEIKTVEVKSLESGGTCIMNYDLMYSKSGREEFLEGKYLGMKEKPRPEPDPYWGDCGGGIVRLRKVASSDFYPEPFLRTTTTPPTVEKKPTPPVVKNNPPKKTIQQEKPPIAKNNVPKKSAPPTTPPVVKTDLPKTTPKIEQPVVTTLPVVKKANPPAISTTPPVLKNRTGELMKILVIQDKEVTVKLYDNGEIDNDSISVYLDNKLILASKRLSELPLTLKFEMDKDNSEHELVMVAENLGRIPPNTSLMIVETANQRHKVQITSTNQKNAVVRFRYEAPK